MLPGQRYILYRQDGTQWEGFSLDQAAECVLTFNKQKYEIRRDNDGLGWTLWATPSNGSSRELVRTRFYVGNMSEEDATTQIYTMVCLNAYLWYGQQVRPVGFTHYDDMVPDAVLAEAFGASNIITFPAVRQCFQS